MTTPVEQLSLKPTTASGVTTITGSTARALGDWKGDVINVKDFGALGDDSHNDTANIQAAFDAAFGPSTASFGFTTRAKAVFFPPGIYRVQSSVVGVVINAAVHNGANPSTTTFTCATAHGLSTNDLVLIQSISGDGDFNGTRRITVGDAGGASPTTKFTTQTKPQWGGGGYTSGGIVTKPALTITQGTGCHIYGVAPYSTVIKNITSGGIALNTNGFQYSRVEGLGFEASGTYGACFVMDLDGDPSHTNGFQGVTFNSVRNCVFFGNGTTGAVGLAIGPTNLSQADTIGIYDCVFNQCREGLIIGEYFNQNAININVFGGEFTGNNHGIYNGYGTIGTISGVDFVTSSGWDIYRQAGGQDNMVVQGCSTESVNFLYANFSNPTIIGCNQRSSSNGVFVEVPTGASIIDCYSRYGLVKLQVGGTIKCSQFFRTDAIFADASWLFPVFIEQCSIGGTLYDYNNPMNSKFDRFTHIKGYFINSSVGTSYFVGQKYAQTSTGASGGGTVITNMLVADLPPVAANLTKGTYVTVFDANATTIGTTVAGGGSNCVLVFNNGTNWRIAAN